MSEFFKLFNLSNFSITSKSVKLNFFVFYLMMIIYWNILIDCGPITASIYGSLLIISSFSAWATQPVIKQMVWFYFYNFF